MSRLALRKIFSNVLVLGGGVLLGQGITLLTAPIVSRLFTPTDFGIYGALMAFVSIVAVVSSLRYETAIVAATSLYHAAHLVVTSIITSTIISALASVCLYEMIKLKLLGFGELPYSSPFLAFLLIVTTNIFLSLRYWLIRTERFRDVRSLTIYQHCARAFGNIGFGYLQIGATGLLWGECLGRLFGISSIIRVTITSIRNHVSPLRFSAIVKICKEYREFPAYSVPSALLEALSTSLLFPIIIHLYGATEAGNLSMVQRVIAIPTILIGGTIADVYYHHAASDARAKNQRVIYLFFQMTSVLALISLVITILLVTLAPTAIKLILGEQWNGAGQVAVRMAPLFLASLIVSPLSRIVLVYQGQKYKLIYDLLGIIIMFLTLFGGKYLGAAFLDTLTGYSCLKAIAYGVYYLAMFYLVRSHERDLQGGEPKYLIPTV